MNRITGFKKMSTVSTEEEYVLTQSGCIPVYTIKSFHTLTQFIGYGKYLNRSIGNVYLRGQNSLYDGRLSPSLLRSELVIGENPLTKTPDEAMQRSNAKFKDINCAKRILHYKHNIKISAQKTKHFQNWEPDKLEPLLQHYGIKTHWIDVVDNTWIALWFATHQSKSIIADNREYIHLFENTESPYAFLLLIGSDALKEDPIHPGLYTGPTTVQVDLRKAVPSYFLRPHAQHAIMLRKNSQDHNTFRDYTDQIIGIAKIAVSDVLQWIGQTGLLSVQSLFPPPYYDTGYTNLLNEYKITEPLIMSERDAKNYIQLDGSIQGISH